MIAADTTPMKSARTCRVGVRGRLILACLAATGVEGLAVWTWIFHGRAGGIVLALVLHCAQAAILWLAAPSVGEDEEQTHASYRLAAVLAFFLPGLGAPGALGAALGQVVMRPRGLACDFEQRPLLAEEEQRPAAPDSLFRFLLDELSTEPIADIVCCQDSQLKRGAIKLLRERGGPEAVQLIQRFMHDTDAEVRLYAHTALVRMQEQMSDRIDAAERKAETGDIEALLSLAQHYRAYAESGLPDDILAGYYMNQACSALQRAHKKAPDDTGLLLRLGEALLDAGRYAEARESLERATRDPALSLEAHLLLCRLHYECRDLAALAKQAHVMRSLGSPLSEDADKIALFRFWSHPHPAPFNPLGEPGNSGREASA
ncbi:hypothetical protein DPQ33_02485 [Oceanidesulfovibrio indonesiensis]|uniref:Tetratricopeptide repeat protein n=1 Tax=Oceanidesulfovibrio indonesiensis TaxID=54767 RepID=A0A7M3MHS5_9BACT|nr:tetratricopeptide repeat protein [Oceanidesulfovibrio indonesiensis]TVM19246.1 hypothetical protein DPQ33_02485 [Oceanidesulfovibrio indonesiensis]